MDTNRLSKKIEAILNRQVTKEAEAAQIYLSYGCWADGEGYGGVANFLFRHANEERNHMMKVMRYIMDRGGSVKIEAIKAPPSNPKNLQDCFEKTFKHEVDNSNSIYEIVNLANEEKDWATYNFAQWFVKEQIEEEKLVMDLLDKLKIAGGPKASNESLFNLDKELAEMPDEVPLAREATEDNPE
ncbi:ferritin [Subsaxibacter sp. CAU 1640]|uniref:ferritin n=1 Tax=Subsaxibacter sp. CAU 1640 TaxID=2933271 RepID=UPI00200541C1|nr:ferritin [Subsaxibacter sp. CAU 1640]MCK7590884.1 ferritin [Subsaxibacter sp. CAU 1640]